MIRGATFYTLLSTSIVELGLQDRDKTEIEETGAVRSHQS